MPYKFGDVILVKFPFSNQAAFKQRPAVVVSSQTYNSTRPDVVMMAITSQLRATAGVGEVWLTEWRLAGLLKPSAVKPVFATVEQTLIAKSLGSLQKNDLTALHAAIAQILS